MSNFTIIKQKLVVIFIIIVFIISSLVFLNSVYNALFVWYDSDNSENVNDINVPVSTMFGYKILLNSFVVKGNCTNYNKDIVLTTNINTILFKIYNLIFTFFVLIIFISLIAEYVGKKSKTSNMMNYIFYVDNKNIINVGIASALLLFIISNNFNNPGKKYYNKYEEDQSTFENYLYQEYKNIDDVNKEKLKKIIKNTNKNNFYEMEIENYFSKSNNQVVCYDILELCQKLCLINEDTSVDVVKVFSDFIDNCEKSNSSEVNKSKSEGRSLTEKYIVDNFDAYFTDLKCIFGELDFLKNNLKSILSLLWWGKDGIGKNINNNNSEVELEPIFFSSLLTKEYLKHCDSTDEQFKNFNFNSINHFINLGELKNLKLSNSYNPYFKELGRYTLKHEENKSFIEMMNDAKKSMYMDLFLIKGIFTGVIIFTLVNIVLKKYYNEYPEGQKTLLEIDKKIILSKIDDNIYDAVKYENFIKPLLKEGNYYVNIVLSIIIILLLLKVIPLYTYPVKAIRFDKIDCT